jgi:hypothetical protein
MRILGYNRIIVQLGTYYQIEILFAKPYSRKRINHSCTLLDIILPLE